MAQSDFCRNCHRVKSQWLKWFWCASRKLVFQKTWKLSSSSSLVLHLRSWNQAMMRKRITLVWDQPSDKKRNDSSVLHKSKYLTIHINLNQQCNAQQPIVVFRETLHKWRFMGWSSDLRSTDVQILCFLNIVVKILITLQTKPSLFWDLARWLVL